MVAPDQINGCKKQKSSGVWFFCPSVITVDQQTIKQPLCYNKWYDKLIKYIFSVYCDTIIILLCGLELKFAMYWLKVPMQYVNFKYLFLKL